MVNDRLSRLAMRKKNTYSIIYIYTPMHEILFIIIFNLNNGYKKELKNIFISLMKN